MSLIKTIQVHQQGVIPPQILIEKLNPELPYTGQYTIPTEIVTKKIHYSLVNSFGASGVNACAILQSFEEDLPKPVSNGPSLFCFSTKTAASFAAMIENYLNFLTKNFTVDFNSLCYSATAGRGHMNEFRCALVANSIEDLKDKLTKLRDPVQLKQLIASPLTELTPLRGNICNDILRLISNINTQI
jgi:iturin family lipopeptide synthetase A